MNETRFAAALLRHGADLQRWPWFARLRARALLAHSPEARLQMERARRLDRAIRKALEPQELSESLLRRLDAIPAQFPRDAVHGRAKTQAEDFKLLRVGAASALACGIVGIVVGASGWISPTGEAEVVARLAAAPLAVLEERP